jgi:D-alanine-D-alanine ligase
VLAALQAQQVNAHGIDADRQILRVLSGGGFDRVFIVLHGRGGEDGVIQGALEILGLPYTGSGVLASALGMDKLRTKQVWRGAGLPTPPWRLAESAAELADAARELGLPLAVKPAREGSSIGISRVEARSSCQAAWEQAAACDSPVLVEPWIQGQEYTGALLGGAALPLIRLETPRTFLRLRSQVPRQRHPLSLSLRPCPNRGKRNCKPWCGRLSPQWTVPAGAGSI